MPAPLGPPVAILLGLLLGYAGHAPGVRAQGDEQTSRSLLVVACFGLLVYAPAAAYFIAFAPDWAYAYVIDTERLPSAVDMAVVLTDAAFVPLGYRLTLTVRGRRSTADLLKLAIAPTLAVVGFAAALLPRLAVFGTHAQFHGDFGLVEVSGSHLGFAVLWMVGLIAAGFFWTLRWLRRLSIYEQR